MSSQLEAIPYVFPFEPAEAPYLKLKKAQKKCEITYQVLGRNDYFGFLEILKIDYLAMIHHLMESNGMPQRWLDIKLPNEAEAYVIFNILVQKEVRENKINGKKLIYGHHILLNIPLPTDGTRLNYSKIKQTIKRCFSSTNPISSFFRAKAIFEEEMNHLLNIQLIIDFDNEYVTEFKNIFEIITNSISEPPRLIQISNNNDTIISKKKKANMLRAIRILTTIFQIKTFMKEKFPNQAKDDLKPRWLSAKLSSHSISKHATNLANAMRFKSLNKVQNRITSIYSNILIIEKRIKEKIEKFFTAKRTFPNLDFVDDLLLSLKPVYEILKFNLIIFQNDCFLKWNELTKKKIQLHGFGENKSLGIVVSKRNFPHETFYYRFKNGNNIFWAIRDEGDEENIGNYPAEPLLAFNNTEKYFGIIASPIFDNTELLLYPNNMLSCGLLVDTCNCISKQIRFWLCEKCQSLVTRLIDDKILCNCQKQILSIARKYCFQCMSNHEHPDHRNLAPSSKVSTVTSASSKTTIITKILIVQVKKEKKSETSSTDFSAVVVENEKPKILLNVRKASVDSEISIDTLTTYPRNNSSDTYESSAFGNSDIYSEDDGSSIESSSI